MGKHEMKRGISQRSSDAGDNQSPSCPCAEMEPPPPTAAAAGMSCAGKRWHLIVLLLASCIPMSTSSINCFRCFAMIDSSDTNVVPYKLTISPRSYENSPTNGTIGSGTIQISYFDESLANACVWSLDIVDESFGSYFNKSEDVFDVVNHILSALVNYLQIHCSPDDNQSWTDAIKFSCLDKFILYRLCEIQRDLESYHLQDVLGSRERRTTRTKRCSLNNLLSTNRKIYEFGLENEGLTSHSQTILSTIYLVTDVITEFYNRKLAHSRKSFYRSDPGRDTENTVVQKIGSSIEIILLQTIKYHILHKLGLRERPNVTRVAKNEYVFEALDRVYGNKINIGNTYAEKHYYSKYLQANLSKDFTNSFVDTFFEATDIGTGGGGLEKQHNFFPKKMKYKMPVHTDSEKQNLFGGTKILSFAEKDSPKHYGSASSNLVGKFTQSVRRIVQDVKDEGSPSGMSREELIETNERLRAVRIRLEESYDTAKKALVTLMNKYGDSKSQRNVFNRYPMLKLMIKDVIRLETQYWTLVEIPKQEKLETVPAFVLRACSIMEKSQKSGEGVKTSAKLAEEAAEKRERMERLEMMTTAQIEQENTQMINDLYRLLKKYTGLRNLIRELKSEYGNSKIYPIFPRYTMLKDMIKDIMHDPDYMEVCHERT